MTDRQKAAIAYSQAELELLDEWYNAHHLEVPIPVAALVQFRIMQLTQRVIELREGAFVLND